MPFSEDEYVSLSALQHYVFCPRQCALIHNEQQWAENALTMMGKLEHERVDSVSGTTRGVLRTARAVSLVCHRLGIRGIADAVEYEQMAGQGNGGSACICRITPVEYKHGRPKSHHADEVQLCAQAFCLEEMHGLPIPVAYLYYRSTRHRKEIVLDDDVRALTERTILETRHLLTRGTLPPAQRAEQCDACSLYERCLPVPSGVKASVYNEHQFRTLLKEP